MKRWTVQDSLELYNILRWGRGLFDVNADGHVVIHPSSAQGPSIDLYNLIIELRERGIELPILLRFPDVVRRRVETIVNCFETAFTENAYKGRYRGVYPIKVNQQGDLVRDMVSFFRPYHMGLEVGSKPEFLIALALLDDPEALIICNGYKDTQYIETALLSRQLGRNPVIVIEKLHEVERVAEAAQKLGIRPRIGVRARLTQPGKGRWNKSAGDKAKFGLTTQGILRLTERLKELGLLDCLELLHFHIGSQVTSIRTFKDALTEATRLYAELARLGAPMGLFDVGGGLGVDYDGSQTNFECSMNYSEQEYANDVVWAIADVCNRAGIPHPNIVTEAGRALTAHHAVLVCDVIGVDSLPSESANGHEPAPESTQLAQMRDILSAVTKRNLQEAWHDALHGREEALQAFNFGLLSLPQRAAVERVFWQICARIQTLAREAEYVPDELGVIEQLLADIYFCNFSIFQSMPDAWAIRQLFPVVPLQRLSEEPLRRGVLADLTCDSDGMLDRFVDLRDVKNVLELHALDDKPYFLGCFLVGAYQEILGDLHNLFGDTNAVHVRVGDDGAYTLETVLEGDTVAEVLGYVHYDRKDLISRVRAACERSIQGGKIDRERAASLLNHYQQSLEGYTYLGG